MGGGMDSGKKASPAILIIVAIAIIVLVAAAYLYMQGFIKDYWPGSITDYGMGDKMMEGDKTETTDAGPEIMLDQDTTADIQGDLDNTLVEDPDKQFTDIDKDLQSL